MAGYIEDLLKKLLGQNQTRTVSTWGGEGDEPQQTQIKKPSNKMSQESMDAYKELRYDLEAAAKRNMPRKSFEGVDFADVKMPQPGLAVEAYAPVSNLGLMPSITGGSKEQRSWEARDEDELWKALRRGLV
tara:strand:+ start:264 stop:656 length:393 start_codon:yes stop_codon:yes gene_type:complete